MSLTLALGGCTVYQIEVEQGNLFSERDLERLKPGLTRRQVTFIMGPPMIEHSFAPGRWDYYHSVRKGDGSPSQGRWISLYFEDDTLERVEERVQPPARLGAED